MSKVADAASVHSASSTTLSSASSSIPHYSVLAVGILTSDIVLDCAHYPAEDESVRASVRHVRPGGNATNSLRVLARLAASPAPQPRLAVSASLLASLGSADSTAASLACLRADGVDTSRCPVYEQHALPTSYIVSAQRTGSRTIVHHRGELPELSAAHFAALAPHRHTLYHFEARSNTAELLTVLHTLSQQQRRQMQEAAVTPFSRWPLVSLELEKPRPSIDALYRLPNLLILSRDYALHLHSAAASPHQFLSTLPADCPLLPQPPHQLLVVCWGAQGSGARLSDGRVCAVPAERVGAVADSVGAGDTFIAALLYGALALKEQLSAADGVRGQDVRLIERLLAFANSVAAAKCRISGIDLPQPVVEQLLIKLYSAGY